MPPQQTPNTAYDTIDFIPVKGLVRSPYDELSRDSVFAHVVNLVSTANIGLWQAREGLRAFLIVPTPCGGVDPDTIGRILSGRDKGNYAVGEVFFRVPYSSNSVNGELVKYIPWTAWLPKQAVDYRPEEYNPAAHPLSINKSMVFDSALFFLQRGINRIHTLPWVGLDSDDTLTAGMLYCFLLPSIEEDEQFHEIPATLGRLRQSIPERYGWGWGVVHSADWSWVSPIGTYTFGRRPASYSIDMPYSSLAANPLGAFGPYEWNSDSMTDPAYWTGRTISLGHYTVITHGGMLRDYWEKGILTEDNVVVDIPTDGGGPSRKSYLIGDILVYDGKSVIDEEQQTQYDAFIIAQENAAGRVGNDILSLDLRLGPGEENDRAVGVEGPLTLYKFYANFSYTLPSQLDYPRSMFDVIKDVTEHPKVPGWFHGKSIYRSDTGKSYFQKTYNPKISLDNKETVDKSAYVDIDEEPTSLTGAFGTFTRNGYTWTGYDPEAWNDAAHKMLYKNLQEYWFAEFYAPDGFDTPPQTNVWLTDKIRRYFYRLDRVDCNHILYTKVLWGTGKRPFISGWTILPHMPKAFRNDEGPVRPASISNAVVIDNDYRHILTNSTEAKPYPDLLSEVILFNPAQSKQTTVGDEARDYEFDVHRAIASGIYRWGEVPVRYYPCSGQIAGMYLQTHLDRLWDRMEEGPRTYPVGIPKEDDPQSILPISGWAYRFVYEYHDGTFSAPSPVYQAPTLLFSELTDDEIRQLRGGVYKRPINYSGDGTELINDDKLTPYLTQPKYFIRTTGAYGTVSLGGITGYFPVLTSALAKVANYWGMLRKRLFPEGHPYHEISLPNVTDRTYLEYIDKYAAQFTLITVFDEAGQHSYKTHTMMGEGLCLLTTGLFSKDFSDDGESNVVFRFVKVYGCIPFLPIEGNHASQNSLFTYPTSPYGAYYRMAYRRVPRITGTQNRVIEWDYLAEGGAYLYYPDWCLRTGGPAGSVSFDNPGQLASNWLVYGSGVNYAPPTWLPLIPLSGVHSFEGGTPLVLPHFAYRRAIQTWLWGDWNENDDVFPMNIPQSNMTARRQWITWSQNRYPYGPSERIAYTYLQWCWEGENLTMSPVRWGTLPNFEEGNSDAFRMSGWHIDPGVQGVAYVPPMIGRNQFNIQLYEQQDFNNAIDPTWFNLFAAYHMYHHHPIHSNSTAEEYGDPGGYNYANTSPGYISVTVDKLGRDNAATANGLWNVLNEQNVTGVVDKLVYLNVICPLWDRGNEIEDWSHRVVPSDVIPDTETIRYRLRLPSVIRYVPSQGQSYGIVKSGIPSSVVERLIIDGIVPLRLAQSRYHAPNNPTTIGFAGTTRSFIAFDRIHQPIAKWTTMDSSVYEFLEYERKGIVANVPHLKSRWCPVITGHALATLPGKFLRNPGPFENLIPILNYVGGYSDTTRWFGTNQIFNTTLNLYSSTRSTEPHLMLFDGVLWHSNNINYRQAPLNWGSLDAAKERLHGYIHLKENPRKMPFWTAYKRYNDNTSAASVREWFRSNVFLLKVEPGSQESLVSPSLTGGVDYPVFGNTTSNYPLANTQYPPSPYNTFLNNFWKYVPIQTFALLNPFDFQMSMGNFNIFSQSKFWIRPYWYYNLHFLVKTSPNTRSPYYGNVGVPSSLSNYFTNYPTGKDLSNTIVVVRFPTDSNGQYIFPQTSGPQATIIAHGSSDTTIKNPKPISREAHRLSYGISDLWFDDAAAAVDSMDIVVYMRGYRALFFEQLSMYKTSKAIFDSPRLGLWFRKEAIPPRVKRIHIYRTRHIDDNAWHPDQFGYVGSVDCTWQYDSNRKRTNDLYFFDNVPDARLDFGDDISRFEALEFGLSSVTATILSERAYYGNIRERYSPLRPAAFSQVRGSYLEGWGICRMDSVDFKEIMQQREILPGSNAVLRPDGKVLFPGMVIITNAPIPSKTLYDIGAQSRAFWENTNGEFGFMVSNADTEGYLSEVHQPYASPCRTVASGYRIYGQIITRPVGASYTTDPNNSSVITGVACAGFYGISYPVDNIEKTLIWHANEWTASPTPANPRFVVGTEVGKASAGTAIDYGVTKKTLKASYGYEWPWFVQGDEGTDELRRSVPCGKDIIYNYNSAIRWSDIRTPHIIRGANIEFVREGDGDEILALVPTYNGNLVVFKRHSIVRLMLAGGFEIARRDQVSNTHGIISPNAWCVYRNIIYFVSSDGIYAYDDNVINKVDGPIADEIIERLQNSDNTIRDPATNLVSAVHNHLRNEIYFNLPVRGSNFTPHLHMHRGVFSNGKPATHGHIFSLHADSGIWTKLQYSTLTENHYISPWWGNISATHQHSGFLHLARNYYRDSKGRFWSVPIAPSTWLHGGQVYLEGPHGEGTRWKLSYDDVFGEVSFRGTYPTTTVIPYSRTYAPVSNIYIRPVRTLWALGGYRTDQTIKTKLRQYAILGYWRGYIDNASYYQSQYDRDMGFEPSLVSTVGLQDYVQGYGSVMGEQAIAYKYAWFTQTAPNQNGLVYNIGLSNPFTAHTTNLVHDDFKNGAEWLAVLSGAAQTAIRRDRAEVWYIYGEAWGAFVLKGVRTWVRPAELWLR